LEERFRISVEIAQFEYRFGVGNIVPLEIIV
jgi:hypothetical protein